MSAPVIVALSSTPIDEAAALMRRHGVGALAVVGDGRLIGVVTDRDIVTRVVAERASSGTVGAAMSPDPVTCRADQEILAAAEAMGDMQVRRLPVLDADGRLVGMISLGDIAENVSEELAGQALGEIAETR